MTVRCVALPELPPARSVRLIGGVELQDVDLERVLQPAMTPLIPILRILEAVVAVVAVFEGIIDLIALDPVPFVTALLKLVKKVGALIALLPQASIPIMMFDILKAFVELLVQVQDKLKDLRDQVQKIEDAEIVAATVPNPQDLLSAIACAKISLAIEQENTVSSLQVFGKLLDVFDLLLGFIGLGGLLPNLADLSGLTLEDTIDAIDLFIKPLNAIINKIPL